MIKAVPFKIPRGGDPSPLRDTWDGDVEKESLQMFVMGSIWFQFGMFRLKIIKLLQF